jgi:MFS family permease
MNSYVSNRWSVLAVLFVVRVSMAFQFQAVAALSPLIMSEFQVGIADIGLLIGLYFAPGIVLAYPGGAIGKRFGDKATVLAGLALMAAGGMIVATSASWEMQVTGRLLAGIGGVLLNVLMTKMLTDWFAGKEIATAMGIFVNSWPFGIALALIVLPGIAEAASLNLAMLVVAGLAMLGFVVLALGYRPPANIKPASAGRVPLRGMALLGVLCAGLIWGLYNAALGMIFGFAPAMLAGQGWTATAASSVTSIVLWLVAISVPLGGIIADRIERVDTVLMTGLGLFAVMLVISPRTDAVLTSFVILGLVAGLSAGPIMSLPSRVLAPENRAVGMGVFYTIYYAVVVVGPLVAGSLADLFGRISIAFDLGAGMLVGCAALLLLFRRFNKSSIEA